MTVIEKMARSLCQYDKHDPDESSFSSGFDPYWMSYIGKARAALATLVVPSAEMIEAGGSVKRGQIPNSRDEATAVWTAMISTALVERIGP